MRKIKFILILTTILFSSGVSAQSQDDFIYPHRKEYRKIDYKKLSDSSLEEKFKDYLSDENFSVESYKRSQKDGVKLICVIADNVIVRRLEKGCPQLFEEVVNRFNKVEFIENHTYKKIVLTKKK